MGARNKKAYSFQWFIHTDTQFHDNFSNAFSELFAQAFRADRQQQSPTSKFPAEKRATKITTTMIPK